MREKILEALKRIVHEATKGAVEPEEVTPGKHFVYDLQVDSLAAVEVVLGLEETFNIRIPDELWNAVGTVDECLDLVEKILKGE